METCLSLAGLSKPWHIPNDGLYFFCIVLLTLAIKLILSSLSAIKSSHESKNQPEPEDKQRIKSISWLGAMYWTVHGAPPRNTGITPNYWFPAIIGSIELSIYPILIALKVYIVVVGWIIFKSLAQWNRWSTDRNVFNLFLIGNLLTIIVSWRLLVGFIEISH